MNTYLPFIVGATGAAALLAVYFLIMILSTTVTAALVEFSSLWYWMVLLSGGFGVQLGLYVRIRQRLKQRTTSAAAEVSTAGGVSTVSMIACCAHHVADVLPLLGVSAAALFLTRFQLPFILLGVFSNIFGITMMVKLMTKHGLLAKNNPLAGIGVRGLAGTQVAVVTVGVLTVLGFGVSAYQGGGQSVAKAVQKGGTIRLSAKQTHADGVSIEVAPGEFTPGKPLRFNVKFTTHSGSLEFRVADIVRLHVASSRLLRPESWEGSPPGGHHRKGVLTFMWPGGDVDTISLIFKLEGLDHSFTWKWPFSGDQPG